MLNSTRPYSTQTYKSFYSFIASAIFVFSTATATATAPATGATANATGATATATGAAVVDSKSVLTPAESAQIVTRVVGQVDTHFITSREVRIDDAIDHALDASPVEYEEALKSSKKPSRESSNVPSSARSKAPSRGQSSESSTGSSEISGGKSKRKTGQAASKSPQVDLKSASGEASDSVAVAASDEAGSSVASQNLLKRDFRTSSVGFSGKILSGDEKTFPNNVSKSLDQWMISLEAQSLQANPPQAGDVSAAVKRVSDYWGNRAGWRSLEVSSEELRTMIERKLLARNFEDFKSNVATAPVSDTDALSYYQRNHARFGNLPFATFKENIRSFLTRQQMEVRMNEWFEVLRRKYKVRNFIAG